MLNCSGLWEGEIWFTNSERKCVKWKEHLNTKHLYRVDTLLLMSFSLLKIITHSLACNVFSNSHHEGSLLQFIQQFCLISHLHCWENNFFHGLQWADSYHFLSHTIISSEMKTNFLNLYIMLPYTLQLQGRSSLFYVFPPSSCGLNISTWPGETLYFLSHTKQ